MSLEEAIIKRIQGLWEFEQAEVLNFIECLRKEAQKKEEKD